MLGSGDENLLVERHFGVEAAGKEGAACAEYECARDERVLDGTVRRGLGDLAEFGGRGILTLGQTVDLVVEEDDVDVDVAADGVDKVVTADCEGVTVTGCLPDAEGRVGHLHTGGNRCCTAVDGVETEGIHIVRETRGTADTGDDDDAFLGISEVFADGRKRARQRCEDSVVTATRAPAGFLIALEVLCCIFHSMILR